MSDQQKISLKLWLLGVGWSLFRSLIVGTVTYFASHSWFVAGASFATAVGVQCDDWTKRHPIEEIDDDRQPSCDSRHLSD